MASSARARRTGQATPDPQAFTLGDSGSQADAARLQSRLFRFFCSMAAYNEDAVYYLHDEARGLRQLQFATPELDIHYAGTDSEEEVEAIDIIGFRAHDRLLNSAYDEGTMTIVSHAKWRGPADASDSGRWLFRNGHFTLVRYEVDASYDGEVNPETVLDGARLRNPAMSRSLQRSRISASTSSTVWTRQ